MAVTSRGAVGARTRHPSLRRRLLFTLMPPLLALGAISAAWDVVVARRLTDDAYDRALASTAIGLAVRLETDADNDLAEHLDATMRAMARIDAPDEWHYLVLDAAGRRLAGEASMASLVRLTATREPRFSEAAIAGERMRLVVYRYADSSGDVTVVVAVSRRRRQVAAAEIVRATLWPNGVLIVAALLVVFGGVRHVLRPLDALGVRVSNSRPHDLTPLLLDGSPREALPLLRALNDLMARLRAAARSQQHFLNQTAHQLRTPLAALQTRLELLRENLPGSRQADVDPLLASANRLARLTHQMLTLARAEPGAAVVPMRPVDLVLLFEQVATEIDDAARRCDVEVEFDAAPAQVDGSDWMLRELLMNLVDNALAHTPARSRVTLRCGVGGEADRAAPFLDVVDEGPGIPAADRERVFEPFFRGTASNHRGAGLGLVIVREVAQRHGARVMLDDPPSGRGTWVRVVFPVAGRQEPDRRHQEGAPIDDAAPTTSGN